MGLGLTVPLIPTSVTRGGILAKVHALLERRDEVHELADAQSTLPFPGDLWARIDDLSRWFFINAVTKAKFTDATINDLVRRARTLPQAEWEAYLLRVTAEARCA